MRNSETDWSTIINWVRVLPMFVLSFVVVRVFFRAFVFRMIFEPISDNKLQLEFVLRHLYDQTFCFAFSILVACVLAPKWRVTISIIFFVFVLLMMPRQIEIAQEMRYYGDLPWKKPFLVAVNIAGGLIPVLIMLIRRFFEKKAEPTAPISA